MAHENDNDPTINPCLDDQPAGPGEENTAEPEENTAEPEDAVEPPPPPPGEEPFPSPAENQDYSNPEAANPAAPDRMEDNAAINEIDFASSTRELSTFNGRRFISLPSLYASVADESAQNLNHLAIKKAASITGISKNFVGDNFRETMLNFFTDDGDIAEIAREVASYQMRNPQEDYPELGSWLLKHKRETFLYSPFGNNNSHEFFENTNVFGFNVPFVAANRAVRPSSDPAILADPNETRSAILEQYQFDFKEECYLNAIEPNRLGLSYLDTLPLETTPQQFYDIFCFGSRSSAWQEISQDMSAETKDFYRAGVIKFGIGDEKSQFFDFCFDSPAAFFEQEANNILISPSHTVNFESNVGNPSFYTNSELLKPESQIPNIYKFYNAKETVRNLTELSETGERIDREGLSERQASSLATARALIQSYTSIAEGENAYQTPEVLKFTHKNVAKFKEIQDLVFREKKIKREDTALSQFIEEELDIMPSNYVKFKIGTSQAGIINNFLKNNNLDLAILELLESGNPGAHPLRNITRLLDDRFITNDLNPTSEGVVDITNNDIVANNLKTRIYPLLEGLQGIVQKIRNDRIQIDEYPLKYENWDNKQLLALDTLVQKSIFMDQMNSYIANSGIQRSFHDIMLGKKAYSEVLGYKVCKYRVLTEEEFAQAQREAEEAPEPDFGNRDSIEPRTLVQTFYFMDSDEVREFEYIDSQVIPGVEYEYEIYTLNFVIASKYRYYREQSIISWQRPAGLDGAPLLSEEDLRRIYPGLEEVNHQRMTLGVISDRECSIIAAPFFKKIIRPEDKKPLFPQVTLLPYHGIDNKIGFLFNTNYGKIREKRIWFKRGVQNYKVNFETDSFPSHFLCVRIEEEPTEWQDFYNSETRQDFLVPSHGKTGFLHQDIEPNKQYYYVFRSIDNYDPEEDGELPKDLALMANSTALSSNPTSIFKVRVVSYDAGIFVEFEPYEMKPKHQVFLKSFENVLKISPAMRQKVINFDQVLNTEAALDESTMNRLRRELGLQNPGDTFEFQKDAPQVAFLSLGPSDQDSAVWERNFKFRVTSKKTGKKIDLNIVFKQTKDIPVDPGVS